MKYKGRLSVALLLIITLVVIYLGYSYANQKQERLTSTAETAESNLANAEESTTENEEVMDISTFEEKREDLSVLEYIKYIELLNGEAKVAFYGQLSEEETWTEEVVASIQDSLSTELTVSNLMSGNTDAYDLYITNSAQNLAETNADVVFYMLPAEGDYIRDISLEDSADYVSRNIDQIQEVLPEALIIVMTPSPNETQSEDYNTRMLSYVQYMESGIEAANEKALPIMDLHTQFLNAVEESSSTLSEMVQEDGFTLNNQGQDLMSDLVKEQLTVLVDTTTGVTE